ncbi:MAG: exodeoxyribonuclease V subunit gamma [Clostridiales bacterium]|jgi:ATP-dependent helicase/nuclease subunit B|nr:exodeoxyribonuclease V subunit gamma [Clostridiales bacterium]
MLRFIFGRAGHGKTEQCLYEITEKSQNNASNALIYIVPEQSTLQAEQDLVRLSRNKAIIRTQALSFQRLAYRLFAETGLAGGIILDDVGSRMLLRKILFELEQELKFFTRAANKPGFLENLYDAVREFYQYNISPSQLAACAGQTPDERLADKLRDLQTVFEGYADFLRTQAGYISSANALSLVPARVKDSAFLSGAEIWIDSFTSFTVQEHKIIEALTQKCPSVTVSLTVDDSRAPYGALDFYDPFFETKNTVNKLCVMARDCGVAIAPASLMTVPRRFKASHALGHLESNFFPYIPQKYSGDPGREIMIQSASNRYEEVAALCSQIIGLVRDSGLAYADIAVVTGALEEYEKAIRSIFGQYGIPFFVDTKANILAHPLSSLIRGAVDCAAFDMRYEGVFRFLKTGLTPIPRREIDILENYVLQYGIHGWKWEREFEDKAVNETRLALLECLAPVLLPLKQKTHTVREYAAGIFDMLDNLSVCVTLDRQAAELAAPANRGGAAFREDAVNMARQHRQIWNAICALFDKMVDLLGDQTLTIKDFAKILEAGLDATDIGLIPHTLDQVTVGDLTRTRLPAVKALFVLGACEGALPKVQTERGIFYDDERAALTAFGLELAPDSRRRGAEELFLIYNCICKPSEYLRLSYATGSIEGKGIKPSIILEKIAAMFPALRHTRLETPAITRPDVLFQRMGAVLRGGMDETFGAVYKWFANNNEYKGPLRAMEEIIQGAREYISPGLLGTMYADGVITTAVSQLEQYARCPFSYFVEYNLAAKERVIYEVQPFDIGNMYHDLLDMFSRLVKGRGISWRQLTDEQINGLVDDCASQISQEIRDKVLLNTARSRYMLAKMKQIAKKSIKALAAHIASGEFEPLATEVIFGGGIKGDPGQLAGLAVQLEDGRRLELRGKIDRIDVLDADGQKYVKIIDYKSGHLKFDQEDADLGLQLQLLMYLNAVLENGAEILGDGNALPGGVFYFQLKDPVIEYGAEDLEAETLKQYKMSGVALADETVVRGIDRDINGWSDIMPVRTKKDGGFAAGSSVLSLDDMNALRRAVTEKAKAIANEILDGHIDPRPFKKGARTGCDYCRYRAICKRL